MPKLDPAVAVTGRHWKKHTKFFTLLLFNLMDQIFWLMLFPAPLLPLNLIIIRQRQPHASQTPRNNRAAARAGALLCRSGAGSLPTGTRGMVQAASVPVLPTPC